MNIIEFAHRYHKLRCADGTARLLDVLPVRIEDLSATFLAYDTDDGKYQLPDRGEFVMLLLEGTRGAFTTLREKTMESHYRSKIGEVFSLDAPNESSRRDAVNAEK